MAPFKINIDESELNDLRQRLVDTRWPEAIDENDWSYGTDQAYLRSLCDHWVHAYDWRANEKAINGFSHFRTHIDGVAIHYLHERGVGPVPMPLILSHGWPWTFWDYQKIIGPLANPAAYGADSTDAFDVVVPSLPGFGFSTPLTAAHMDFATTAELWVKLMRDELGHASFAAQGGDFGALVTAQLGHAHADKMIGIHLHFMLPIDSSRGGGAGFPDADDYSVDEAAWFTRNEHFLKTATAYSAVQRTRPQTISYALNDSPVGLLAWIVEKRRAWSDCAGDVEARFTRDDLITTAMIYWLTASYGTTARYYAEPARNGWAAAHARTPIVEAPTAALIFPEEVLMMPRAWVKRYFNLQRWTIAERGGHFAPMEEPDLLVNDIRAFFRPLRNAAAQHIGTC